MSKNHFIRFLRQFRDTNQYLGIQAVSRNHLITPSKMIFRDTREVGTSRLIDPIAFENKGNYMAQKNEVIKQPVLELKNIKRWFGKAETRVDVLKGVDLTVHAGEIVALVGPSGSGKSTLLQIAGLLDTPSGGDIYIAGQKASKATDRERTKLRQNYMGFVYQSHLLLPDFTALENVMIPQMLAGVEHKAAAAKASDLLGKVGLGHRLTHRSGQLSGGEQQRVAIARSLANDPKLLLADEPTGNLDPHTADEVFKLFLTLVRETGLSAIIATHNPELAAKMDRRVTVRDGQIVELK